MNWIIMWQIALAIAAGVQIILVLLAEYNEEYTRAAYEMLWFLFFYYLWQNEWKKND